MSDGLEITVCATCHNNAVRLPGESSWLLGWWPHVRDNAAHSHDPNRRLCTFRCEAGHLTQRTYFIPCPTCGAVAGPTTEQAVRPLVEVVPV